MAKETAKDKLKSGWIHILVTFEILGKPKKHVDESLRLFLDTIKKEERIHYLEEHVGKAEKAEGNEEYFSAFAEVDMLVKNMETMTWLCVNFTPASIEIIEPLDFKFSALDVQNWQNDVLSNLHNVGAQYKRQATQVEYLKEQLVNLMQNTIILSLSRGAKDVDALAKDTSLTKVSLDPQLKKLVETKKIVEKKGVYSLK